jgi:hypothetical protein
MISYGNLDMIGGVGCHRGGLCVAVAARALAVPGCDARWRPAGSAGSLLASDRRWWGR